MCNFMGVRICSLTVTGHNRIQNTIQYRKWIKNTIQGNELKIHYKRLKHFNNKLTVMLINTVQIGSSLLHLKRLSSLCHTCRLSQQERTLILKLKIIKKCYINRHWNALFSSCNVKWILISMKLQQQGTQIVPHLVLCHC